MDGKPRDVKIWVKLFVAFHVIAITVWSLPISAKGILSGAIQPRGSDVILLANDRYMRTSPIPSIIPEKFWPIRVYAFYTGTWQYWDMFAPNPATTDIWCHAEVEREDGTVERFDYPRMASLPIPEKYVKERYRKFYERVNQDQYQFLWPIFSQRIALKMDSNPTNRPKIVRLYRHFMTIPKPGNPMPKDYTTVLFYEHAVDRELLDAKLTFKDRRRVQP